MLPGGASSLLLKSKVPLSCVSVESLGYMREEENERDRCLGNRTAPEMEWEEWIRVAECGNEVVFLS